jgi:hypothetical protein
MPKPTQPIVMVLLPPEVAKQVHRALTTVDKQFEAELRRLRPPCFRRAVPRTAHNEDAIATRAEMPVSAK